LPQLQQQGVQVITWLLHWLHNSCSISSGDHCSSTHFRLP
jgi:hypothetical protein